MDSDVLKERIIRSLQRGNLQPVTVSLQSKRLARKYIYANPEVNSIVILTPATGAANGKVELLPISELPELEQVEDEPVSDSIFKEDVAVPLANAHL